MLSVLNRGRVVRGETPREPIRPATNPGQKHRVQRIPGAHSARNLAADSSDSAVRRRVDPRVETRSVRLSGSSTRVCSRSLS
jgi:hypothetical protein